MRRGFQILALTAIVALSLTDPSRNALTIIEKAGKRDSESRLNVRVELTRPEYIQAERCLMRHPPVVGTVEGAQNVWDELHWTHIWQGNYIHFVGHFFPWHRYLVRTHEHLLQHLCGYSGAQPYWDELTDYESGPLHESAIFDPVFGFGGDGDGEEGCIQDGPFRDTTLHLKAHGNGENTDYCISRALNQTNFGWANRSNIDECYAMSEYTDAWECYNGYPHSAGHAALGGVMFDTIYSNGDPVFYLHHAYVDRLWWQWQQADLPNRLYEIGGSNVPPQEVLDSVGLPPPSKELVDHAGDEGDETTLAHVLWMHGITPNVTTAEVMDLGGKVICADFSFCHSVATPALPDSPAFPVPLFFFPLPLPPSHPSLHTSDTDTKKVTMANGPEKPELTGLPPYDGDLVAEMSERERTVYEHGMQKFNRLGWKRLTIVLIVEAIALGSLSLPSTFATLGMVAGVICTVGLGLLAIYTSYVVGQVKLKFPLVHHYPDAVRLMFGRFGYELVNFMLILQLLFLTGSHTLTGAIAWIDITQSGVCSVVFAVISAIILFLLAVPPSFTEMAILGYIDFASIIIAIGITMISTGIQSTNDGGLSQVNWSAWPKEDISFTDAFISLTNIIFAYSFAMCQFSFMDEMHTPQDYVKSIWSLGIIEIFIYTLTGALIYAFVGQDVQSPALLSAGTLMSRIAFGIALPVIFISGSINTVVAGRIVHGRIFKDSPIRFINTKMGWITWLAVIAVGTVIAFIIAEVIPFFNDLLSISSSLFISGFTFYFPALMWFILIREGPWNSRKNLALGALNLLCMAIGFLTLVAGTYSSVKDIVDKYNAHAVRGVFSCSKPQ
ncbi:transmembrane amino acid transporter protein-domain-containing protein [Aspergillus egyptiacus]|nr:transmembrane amino acid transporter protein-domain-containing protein [Aspergillus egyptiacus]